MLDTLLLSGTAFIIALGILITVHEFGHFLVARYCGVHIESFSIGFGKPLYTWYDSKGTQYMISIIPLGGFVKMLVINDDQEMCQQAFNNKTILQRAAIIIAGPLANIFLAMMIYWVVFLLGIPINRPIINEVKSGSIAFQAGLRPQMEFQSIGNIVIFDWNDVRIALITKMGLVSTRVKLIDWRSSQPIIKYLNLSHWYLDPEKNDPLLSIGIKPYALHIEPILSAVQPESAASRAGLKIGDQIIQFDGHHLIQWQDFVNYIRHHAEQTIRIVIKRHNKILNFSVSSIKKSDKDHSGFIGVSPKIVYESENYKFLMKYDPVMALIMAAKKTWQLINVTVSMLKKLILGKANLSHLSGPLSMAQGAGISARYGLIYYLMFLALISVNLGIINMFPLPVLDGGHFLFLIIETIQGKTLSNNIKELSYRIGTIILIILMLIALFNDFSRILLYR
ncbi:MAG: sigma E protease regulator RseP [Candidatus Dasytiphilus stammeri]